MEQQELSSQNFTSAIKKQVKNKSKIRYCNMKNLIVVTNLSKRQKKPSPIESDQKLLSY
jgi:hypothetical protein